MKSLTTPQILLFVVKSNEHWQQDIRRHQPRVPVRRVQTEKDAQRQEEGKEEEQVQALFLSRSFQLSS